MKKVFILICLLVLLTGCTGKYNIDIKKDGKVVENFEMTFDNDIIDTNNIDAYFNDTIRQYRENNMFTSYKIQKKSSKDKSTIYVTRKFNDINDLINNSEILPSIFEKISPYGEYNEYGLITTGEYYKASLFEDEDTESFEKVDISVNSELKILSSNADKFDNESNTLYWNLDNTKDNFSMSFKFNNSKRYDIIIKNLIKTYWVGALAIAILSIVIFVIAKILKKRNQINNEI